MPKLEYLDLDNNQLSGSIPNFSTVPNLTFLYLSSNQLCKDKNTNYGKWQSTVNQYPDCPTSEPQTYTLSTSSDPENGGSVSRSPAKDLYIHNETVNLTASPNQCYKFTGWGDACSGSSSCELTMDRDKSVIANFKIKSFKLNISSDNGIVKREPNKTLYDCGETVKLTAIPNKGYEFTAWSGDVNSTNKSIIVNMDTDLNLKAMFIVTDDIGDTAELKVTPSGPLTLSFGENIELTASGGQPPYNWSVTDGELTPKKFVLPLQ